MFSPRVPENGGAESFNLLSPSNIQLLGANSKNQRESKMTNQKVSNEPQTRDRAKVVGQQIERMISKNAGELKSESKDLSIILEPTQGSQWEESTNKPSLQKMKKLPKEKTMTRS